MVMPPQKRLGLSCAGCGSAGFSSLIAGASSATGVGSDDAIAAGDASGIASGAVSGSAFAEVSIACDESVGDAVAGSYDVIAYLFVTEEESTACGTSVGDGTSVGVGEASGACAAGSVTSCAERQHGKSNSNAKESANGCFKIFLLIDKWN